MLLRSEFSAAPVSDSAARSLQLEEGTLDVAPDGADCWVFGSYWCALGRSPTSEELKAGSASIRSGARTPEEVLAHLHGTEESFGRGAPGSSSPEITFVTGCYAAILGRAPDKRGLDMWVAALLDGQSQQTIVDAFSASAEARARMRFPGVDRFDFDSAIGEALQVVVLGTRPVPALTAELADRVRSDTSVAALVRELLLQDTRKRAAVRAFLICRQLTAAVLTDARLRRLQHDIECQQAWEWRVDRRTWAMIDDACRQMRQLEAKVAALAEDVPPGNTLAGVPARELSRS
jgi:hypothetical protein